MLDDRMSPGLREHTPGAAAAVDGLSTTVRQNTGGLTYSGAASHSPAVDGTLAIIHPEQPSATQSPRRANAGWILEFQPTRPPLVDPLTGWTGTTDPRASEVRIRFASRATAERFAQHNGWRYVVLPRPERRRRPKSYAENFIR